MRTRTVTLISSGSTRREATRCTPTAAPVSSRFARNSSQAATPATPPPRSSASTTASTSPSSVPRASTCSTTTARAPSASATPLHRSFSGQASVELAVESTYTDHGATASDSVDGDLSTRIKVDDPVNPAVVGTYTVTYSVVDNSGNAAAPVTRTVRVGVRSGTGGGGGGAFDLIAVLLLTGLAITEPVGR